MAESADEAGSAEAMAESADEAGSAEAMASDLLCFLASAISADEAISSSLSRSSSSSPSLKLSAYQVVELGAFGSFGLMQYVERAGLIFSHYMGHGESDNDFFEIKEGQAVLICNMHLTPLSFPQTFAICAPRPTRHRTLFP